ncbi:MAG: NFACT RNA binding domain-containing protein [Chloroflexi bacterium]|nr:NFACT RNA binding domain-containing protein [Chloroflexota bacterium]
MSFDTFTISALVDELGATIAGGRVQDVIDVDANGIGLEIYADRARHYLYLSADSALPRAHLVARKLRRGMPKPSQLGLLLRRYVKGGKVVRVSQPPWERLLAIEFEGHEGAISLIAELMPRRANVLLVQAGVILDCLNRVGPEDNRYRLSLPNHDYVPPPPLKGQLDPARVTASDLAELLADAEKDSLQTRRLLPGKVLGMSPLMAKEIVFRAAGDALASVRDTDAESLYIAYQDLVAPMLKRNWQPGIGSSNGVPVAISVFPLRHLEWQSCESISEAIDNFVVSVDGADAYKVAKQPVQAAIDEARAKLSAKLSSLRRSLRDDSELERLRQSGELILAYQYTIGGNQTELRAQYDSDAPELVIVLDPDRSPLENAQSYFRRYDKAKGALEAVPALIVQTRTELQYIEQLENDLLISSNWPEIDDVIQSLQSRGHWQGVHLKRLGGGGRQGPLRVVSRDGYVIFVGRNSRQNEAVTFKSANPQDIWLHARDVPGAHVVIRNDGRRIKDELIAEAAAVAAYYSKLREDSRIQVDYTRVKYVKAIKGAGPGMVTYRNESSVFVRPQDENILM